jgi:ATP-dependent RNA helicase RhlE
MNFENLGLIQPIQKALTEEGYSSPTPIQLQAIPHLLKGRDLLACAQTGTGKTAAFSLPIIQHLVQNGQKDHRKKIKALILTPTRELAIQIGESIQSYAKYTPLKYTVIFGGVKQNAQVNTLRTGVDILVATPGRLLDLIQQGFIRLSDVSHFVLDEADRMLDMGFIHDVKKIVKILPLQRQTLLFSATMPDSILELAHSMLKNPERVEVTPVSSTAETISQEVFFVNQADKNALLLYLLKHKIPNEVLVFTRTKHGANKLVKVLQNNQIRSEAIHGNKSQTARQNALSNFKNGKIRVLVATDIAARGIDIDQLEYVVNYELPNISETYIHRIGRSGRAGFSGHAISFCNDEERAFLKDIEKLIKTRIPVTTEHPYVPSSRQMQTMQISHAPRKDDRKPAKNDRRRTYNNSSSQKVSSVGS